MYRDEKKAEKEPEWNGGQIEENTETSLGVECVRRLSVCVAKAW